MTATLQQRSPTNSVLINSWQIDVVNFVNLGYTATTLTIQLVISHLHSLNMLLRTDNI